MPALSSTLDKIRLPWTNASDLKDRCAVRPNGVDLLTLVHIMIAGAEDSRVLAGGASAEGYGHLAGNDRYAFILAQPARSAKAM